MRGATNLPQVAKRLSKFALFKGDGISFFFTGERDLVHLS